MSISISRSQRPEAIGTAQDGRVVELQMERDLLVKTIGRLHGNLDEQMRNRRTRLLAVYQRRLGEIVGEMEWLRSPEAAATRGVPPDMGQKLSSIEEKINNISATISTMRHAAKPATKYVTKYATSPNTQKKTEKRRPEVPGILLPDIEIDEVPDDRVRRRVSKTARPKTSIKPTVPAQEISVHDDATGEAAASQAAPKQDYIQPKKAAKPVAGADTIKPSVVEPEVDDLESLKRQITKTLSKLSENEV